MKEIVIFGSYCNTKDKLSALENSITQAKSLGLDVLVFGRYPIPESTQKMCDYWIYDKSNPIIHERSLNHWYVIENKYISNWFDDYGYAALEQITKSLGFVNNLGYETAYWLVYDVDLTEFQTFREISLNKLLNHQVVCHKFTPVAHQPEKGLDGTSIAFKINPSFNKLQGVMSKTFYRDLITRRDNFISEDFMEECFKVSELNYHTLETKPNLPATLTSTGLRKHGDIPADFPKTKQYFDHCNIGWDEDKDNVNVFIWGLKQHIHSITFNFGDNKHIILDKSSTIEFNLDYKPTKCKIIEINGEVINEVLDPELTDLYWGVFKIRNMA